MSDKTTSLKITEVFLSIQGESLTVGLPTVFVRLTGCPLRCSYCDSEYAFYGGERKTLHELLQTVDDFGVEHVCVTGGEPLAQSNVKHLLSALCNRNYQVSLETSGALSIAGVDPRVSVVMDLKAPSSNEVERNHYDNIELLKPTDQIKFVILDRQDYDWAVFKLREYQLHHKVAEVLFSPGADSIEHATLVDWIIEDKLPVRFQLQLHKILWGDKTGV